ncbi:cyclophilin-like family protein [Candidatus Nitrosotalea bavarica]|uniref:cyclophilin-like family protein n=1 Tax=Candidatus Nitrosotalea bavarica TaxID=1903277 RepID=UPI000C711312|nr:cyclophilin-like family protein [Candidatus Nitrosotalea bavarica]
MLSKITITLPQNKSLEIELDDSIAPKTVHAILDNLPISVDVHIWGEEMYTDPIPVMVQGENSKPLVNLLDVAYWPPGQAICLFFGPTPIGNKGEIKPYSPVNVIGKIISKDVKIPINLDGEKIILRSSC